jgi:hypothetical protein
MTSDQNDLCQRIKNTSYIALISVIVLVTVGYLSTFVLPKDNPIEQASEELIYDETGVYIDLSP